MLHVPAYMRVGSACCNCCCCSAGSSTTVLLAHSPGHKDHMSLEAGCLLGV